eukprot:GSA120T00005481001.1
MATLDSLFALALQAMNGITLLGAVFVKAPQLLQIHRAQSVAGISEQMVVGEVLSCACSVIYNVIKGFPFATWGEAMFLWVQSTIQVMQFWQLANPKVDKFPRFLLSIVYAMATAVLLLHGEILLNDVTLNAIGTIPAVLGTASRLPQIIKNARQKHTGTLSIITWFLSFGGCAMRVVTTLALLGGDMVAMTGHTLALTMNAILVLQILYFWKNTQVFMEAEKKKKAQE